MCCAGAVAVPAAVALAVSANIDLIYKIQNLFIHFTFNKKINKNKTTKNKLLIFLGRATSFSKPKKERVVFYVMKTRAGARRNVSKACCCVRRQQRRRPVCRRRMHC
jgi:hypothetical protein